MPTIMSLTVRSQIEASGCLRRSISYTRYLVRIYVQNPRAPVTRAPVGGSGYVHTCPLLLRAVLPHLSALPVRTSTHDVLLVLLLWYSLNE